MGVKVIKYHDSPDEYKITCEKCGTDIDPDNDDGYLINGDWHCAECFTEKQKEEEEDEDK